MRSVNPAYIPRNHLVEEMISAAVEGQDYGPFEAMLQVLMNPYEEQAGRGAICRAAAGERDGVPDVLRDVRACSSPTHGVTPAKAGVGLLVAAATPSTCPGMTGASFSVPRQRIARSSRQ